MVLCLHDISTGASPLSLSLDYGNSAVNAMSLTENLVPSPMVVDEVGDEAEDYSEVCVAVRVRPNVDSAALCSGLVASESEHSVRCTDPGGGKSGAARELQFSYDKVFSVASTQADLMHSVGVPVVRQVMRGFNGTIMCYGQSGSGKTFTMIGPEGVAFKMAREEFDACSAGLLPRCLEYLFADLNDKHPKTNPTIEQQHGLQVLEEPWVVELSAVELYNEELKDLLSSYDHPSGVTESDVPLPSHADPVALSFHTELHRESFEPSPLPPLGEKEKGSRVRSSAPSHSPSTSSGMPSRSPQVLRIRRPSERAGDAACVKVDGLSRHVCRDAASALRASQEALRRRRRGKTRLNSRSNRSHTLFLIYVTQSFPDEGVTIKSLLTMVDLAGSERVSKTGAQGSQLREAQQINLSLTFLGNVMRRLADSGNKSIHIPYRDSKLTQLLQDSFGGNSVTFLVCNFSPEDSNRSETISTLRFAQVARKVKNTVQVNAIGSAPDVLEKRLALALEYIGQLEAKLKDQSDDCLMTRTNSVAPAIPPVVAPLRMAELQQDECTSPVQWESLRTAESPQSSACSDLKLDGLHDAGVTPLCFHPLSTPSFDSLGLHQLVDPATLNFDHTSSDAEEDVGEAPPASPPPRSMSSFSQVFSVVKRATKMLQFDTMDY